MRNSGASQKNAARMNVGLLLNTSGKVLAEFISLERKAFLPRHFHGNCTKVRHWASQFPIYAEICVVSIQLI